MLTVVGPKDKVPAGAEVLNTTSRSQDWGRAFSPFLLGPCKLYSDFVSQNVENGWQYSKVYPEHAGSSRIVTDEYWKWATQGWANPRAVRYPMGKGAKPLYSLWNGIRMDYIMARKFIYIPLYSNSVMGTDAFWWLSEIEKDRDIYLWDFDGYNHRALGMTYEDVINNPNRTMGHAFIIAMLIHGSFDITHGPFWSFHYKQKEKQYYDSTNPMVRRWLHY
jgi:hypothetical protein